MERSSVLNLATGEVRVYSLHATDAVVAAYAQGTLGDYNTWDYHQYRSLVEYHRWSVSCGDWTTMHRDWTTITVEEIEAAQRRDS